MTVRAPGIDLQRTWRGQADTSREFIPQVDGWRVTWSCAVCLLTEAEIVMSGVC